MSRSERRLSANHSFATPLLLSTHLKAVDSPDNILQTLVDHPMLLDGVQSLELLGSDDDCVEGPTATRDVLHLQMGRVETLREEIVDVCLAR